MSQKNVSDTLVPYRWILRINKILEKGPRDDRGVYVLPVSNYRDASPNPIPRFMLLIWVVSSFLICLLYASVVVDSPDQPLYYVPVIPVALAAYFSFARRQVPTFVIVLTGITTILSVITMLLLLLYTSRYLLASIGVIATCINIYVLTRVIKTNSLIAGFGTVSNKSEWSQRNQENDTYLAQALPAMPRWWGTPGSSLSSSGLNQENVKIGQVGEKYTARIIGTYIQRHPHAFTLHSVRWPGLEDADLDHILVVNRTILVIDSKKWQSNAIYSFATAGDVVTVTRDGWEFSGGKIHLARAIQSVRNALKAQGFLGTYSVSGVLVIHGQSISLTGQTHPDFVAITENGLSSLLENVGSNPAMTIGDHSVSEYIDPLTLLPALQLFLDVDNGLSPWSMSMVSRFSDGLSPKNDFSPIEIPDVALAQSTLYNDEDDESFRSRLNIESATQLLRVSLDADIDEIRSAWEYLNSLNPTRFSDLNEEQIDYIEKLKGRIDEAYLFLEEHYRTLDSYDPYDY